jgi:hypothetical protein
MKAALRIGASTLVLLLPVATVAQEVEANTGSKQALARAVLAGSVANGVNDAQLKGGASGVPDLQLLVSDKENVGSIAVSFDKGGTISGDAMITNAFVLRAFGKLKNGEGAIIGLDGFVGNSGIEFSFIRYSTKLNLQGISNAVKQRQGLEQAFAACLQRNTPLPQNSEPTLTEQDRAKIAAEVKTKCGFRSPVNNQITGVPGGLSSFVETYAPTEYQNTIKENFDNTEFFGATVSASQQSFEYIDRSAFKSESASKLSLAGSMFGGLIGKRLDWSLTGGFRYQRTYKAADEVNLCKALATAGLSQCLTGADGSPALGEQALLSLEFRKLVASTFAIAPRASVDVKTGNYSVDMPVYFAPDSGGGLRGGVRGTFVSKEVGGGGRKDSFALSLFIGVPFSIFTN